MQSTGLPAPTVAEKQRFQVIQDIGCIACIMKTGIFHTPPQIHHQLDHGRRISHSHSVGLCPWHHDGIIDTDHGQDFIRKMKGPSMKFEPAAFVEEFGTDEEMLEYQNALITKYLDTVTVGAE
jgi:hypothetical protein